MRTEEDVYGSKSGDWFSSMHRDHMTERPSELVSFFADKLWSPIIESSRNVRSCGHVSTCNVK